MVAEIVHCLGVSMGTYLLEADCWNQHGYFEDRQLLGLHRVMSFAHGDSARIALNLPALTPRPTPGQLARYRRVLAQRRGHHTDWGFKDPRFVYLWPRLRPLLDDPDVRVIRTKRALEESTASLYTMLGCLYSEAVAVIADYTAQADRLAVDDPVLEVDYATALDDPPTAVARIAAFLDRAPTPLALSVINPALRRHTTATTAAPEETAINWRY
jgi:hypothetical protein